MRVNARRCARGIAASECDGNTPLHVLATDRATQPWAVAVAQLLLANGASGRLTNEAGQTPAGCVPDDEEEDEDEEDGGDARDGELYALLLAAEAA